MNRTFVLVAAACATACSGGGDTHSADSARAADSLFAAVQARGGIVMGVDQYTSTHYFEDLADGGRIVLVRNDTTDSAGTAAIRTHIQEISVAFHAGDFAKPFDVHDREVPGTKVMSERRDKLSYQVANRAGGGEVRITTTDSLALRAVHEFLRFQREDHRAMAHDSAHSHGDHAAHMGAAKGRSGG